MRPHVPWARNLRRARHDIAAIVAVAAALVAGGCGGGDADPASNGGAAVTPASSDPSTRVPVSPAEARAQLRDRAETLLQAQQDADWETVFGFEVTEPQAKLEDFIDWCRTERPFTIESFEVTDVAVDGDLGWVESNNSVGMRRFPDMPPRPVRRWEKWRRDDDGLWRPIPALETEYFPAAPAERDLEGEAALRERFDAAWQARVVQDWDTLRDMVDPDDRAPADREKPANLPLIYFDNEVHWIEVVGDRGIVRVTYDQKIDDPSMTKMPMQSLTVNETWIRRGGTWYLDMSEQE